MRLIDSLTESATPSDDIGCAVSSNSLPLSGVLKERPKRSSLSQASSTWKLTNFHVLYKCNR